MQTVYRLQDDPEQVDRIQRATLDTEEFGIEPTHGLVGSDEWWAKFESGELPNITLSGTITRVYMGSMGDWPEFELTTAAGVPSSWTREANSADLAEEYVEGKVVEIDYVLQRHRAGSWDGGGETKLVLEIRVGGVATQEA